MGQYATIADMQAQGASGTSSRILEALETASRTIDRLTGVFFEKRTAQTYKLDGSGTPILELPAPCLTLTSIVMDGQAVDLTWVVNRNRTPDTMSDDYWYPRLEWKSSPLRMQRAFGPRYRSFFWPGEENVTVVGDFGFVVDSFSPTGTLVTPTDIKRACILLATTMLRDVASEAGQESRVDRFLQSESIGNYSYAFGSIANAGNPSMSGDPDVDALLLQYRRAPQMGTAG